MDLESSELYFHQEPVGQMANLAYLVGSRSTRQALVVDPAWDGLREDPEFLTTVEKITSDLADMRLRIQRRDLAGAVRN